MRLTNKQIAKLKSETRAATTEDTQEALYVRINELIEIKLELDRKEWQEKNSFIDEYTIVEHPKYGRGVVAVSDPFLSTVKFESGEEKKIVNSYLTQSTTK
ncbi:MAG: hypothetical protein GY738_21940 [Pseudoalteromonas sp.]|nr:hypothetical protein [Pseudoalteromonas sp.]